MDLLDVHDPAQRLESLQRSQRFLDSVRRKQACRLHLAAKAAQRLLIEDLREIARLVLIDDETNGVRPDVDDRDFARCNSAGGFWSACTAARRRLRREADAPNGA